TDTASRHLRPSGRKSMQVPASPVVWIRRDPNPLRVGAFTRGPRVSCHVRCNLGRSGSPTTAHDTRTLPVPLDNAPYLVALVASSWRQRVRLSDVAAGTHIGGPSATKRFFWLRANGFSARSITSRRGAWCQFSMLSSSWASLRACKRVKNFLSLWG